MSKSLWQKVSLTIGGVLAILAPILFFFEKIFIGPVLYLVAIVLVSLGSIHPYTEQNGVKEFRGGLRPALFAILFGLAEFSWVGWFSTAWGCGFSTSKSTYCQLWPTLSLLLAIAVTILSIYIPLSLKKLKAGTFWVLIFITTIMGATSLILALMKFQFRIF